MKDASPLRLPRVPWEAKVWVVIAAGTLWPEFLVLEFYYCKIF
jgi:hypothetical protein